MNEIEEKFYKTFGIEPRYEDACKLQDEYFADENLANTYVTFDRYLESWCPQDTLCTDECKYAYDKVIYPKITDRILLELICILSNFTVLGFLRQDRENLTKNTLERCIYLKENGVFKDEITNQVQSLFKGGE